MVVARVDALVFAIQNKFFVTLVASVDPFVGSVGQTFVDHFLELGFQLFKIALELHNAEIDVLVGRGLISNDDLSRTFFVVGVVLIVVSDEL